MCADDYSFSHKAPKNKNKQHKNIMFVSQYAYKHLIFRYSGRASAHPRVHCITDFQTHTELKKNKLTNKKSLLLLIVTCWFLHHKYQGKKTQVPIITLVPKCTKNREIAIVQTEPQRPQGSDTWVSCTQPNVTHFVVMFPHGQLSSKSQFHGSFSSFYWYTKFHIVISAIEFVLSDLW